MSFLAWLAAFSPRFLPRVLMALLCLCAPVVQADDRKADILIEVRDQTGAPLTGYLLVRPQPPDLDALAVLDLRSAATRYYEYFSNPASAANYKLRVDLRLPAERLEEAPLLLDGVFGINQSDIVLTEPLSAARTVSFFFYWSSDRDRRLPDTGSTAERIARTDRVTWWTLYLDGAEAVEGRRFAQRVTVMDKNRWTEGLDFRDEPFGDPPGTRDGYVPGQIEKQCYVLEPPIGDDGSYVLPDASETGYRHPVLMVHGVNGTAGEWKLDSETSIPQYLRRKGHPVWELYYGAGQENLADSAEMLDSAIRNIRAAHPRSETTLVDVVTHSYGGVVLRKALQAQPGLSAQLGRLLMIGPPHHGSYAASRIRGYRDIEWGDLRRRLGLFGSQYNDPLAPVYVDLTPGSAALLALEQEPEAFREFQPWADLDGDGAIDRSALVLAGYKPSPRADEAQPRAREAPEHADGIVSMSSASLGDTGVGFASIYLNHEEQLGSEFSAAAIAAYLENPLAIGQATGVEASDILRAGSGNCGSTARAGLTVDLRGFRGCGQSRVSGVAWSAGSVSPEDAAPLLANGAGAWFYWSDRADHERLPQAPGSYPTYPGMAVAVGRSKADILQGNLRISCESSSAFLYPVALSTCRTFTVWPDAATVRQAMELSLQKTGPGSVSSQPTGLLCGAACTGTRAYFPPGTVVLTADPASGFQGWSGSCTGTTPTCTLNMDGAKAVTARFATLALSSLTISPATVASGGSATGQVTLTVAAPSGGTVVSLQSDNTEVATVPAGVTVPAGQTSATFTVTARTVTANRQAVIAARLGGDSRTAVLTVTPPPSGGGAPFTMQFAAIPAGEFAMGCSADDTGCFPDESPRHSVRLTKPFEIGKFEVTQAQWEAVMGANPSANKGADLPVTHVTWNDAQAFLTRLNERGDGYRYRLPTEAEWEYAARAGTAGKNIGGATLADVAWFFSNSGGRIHPVGQKTPNAWGLHDMLGNVWEWVQDWSLRTYTSAPVTDPAGPSSGTGKLFRGGGYNNDTRFPRPSFRLLNTPPDGRGQNIGFRCVRERSVP